MSSLAQYTIYRDSFFEGEGMCHYMFYTKSLKEEITVKLSELIEENEIDGRFHIEDRDKMYIVHYDATSHKSKSDEGLAHVISDMIQKAALLKVCHQYLKKREDLPILEKREITEAFLRNNYLSRQEGFSYITYYLLYLPIYNEIKEKQTLNIEGWIQFRLGKYKILIKDILQQFIEDYVTKKEVITFIKLMREASLLAVPLEEEIHILCKAEGQVQLYNKAFKNMTGYYIKKYCKELLLDSTLTREDLLLHVLITICPKTIVVHKKENMKTKQFMNTLEIIFEENIRYCTTCDFCKDKD